MKHVYEMLRSLQISFVHLQYSNILMSGNYDVKLRYIKPDSQLWKWQIIDIYGNVIKEN